jgi:hypothetical protein
MSLIEIASDYFLEASAHFNILFEALLPFREGTTYRLSDKRVLRVKVRIESAVGQACRSHDPADAGAGNPFATKAFRGSLENMPSSRGFVTFFKTHLLFLGARSRQLAAAANKVWRSRSS